MRFVRLKGAKMLVGNKVAVRKGHAQGYKISNILVWEKLEIISLFIMLLTILDKLI